MKTVLTRNSYSCRYWSINFRFHSSGLNGETRFKNKNLKVFIYKLNVLLISTCSWMFSYASVSKACKYMEAENLSNEQVLYTELELSFWVKTLFKIRCWVSLYYKIIDSSVVNGNFINCNDCGFANSSMKIKCVCQIIWLQ
jgi:hypothetical protein